MDDLNRRLDKPLPMNRFRPNIVVTGCRAAEEDEWQKYTIGHEVVVEAVKPCDRCKVSMAIAWVHICSCCELVANLHQTANLLTVLNEGLNALSMTCSVSVCAHGSYATCLPVDEQVTCTDQETAEVGEEPLVTLKEFRSSAALGWRLSDKAVFFGWNLVPVCPGKIQINDDIEVIQRRKTIVAVPSQADRASVQLTAATPQKQEDILKGAGVSALHGIAAAVCVASILISFMYVLLHLANPPEPYVQPT